ncbi:MAG TPA: hypothetical protein VMP89_07070, partial [Solirubrobacteraceae bacterium]|nr:hypothetical protein [Solirubrobacteraceae bacterium]
GYACDGEWADDFHHALRAVLTDEREGYYADFGEVSQLAKAYHRPHVRDGGYSKFMRRRFGAPADDIPCEQFVVFSQNHDQVGNRAFGDRMPAEARPLAAFCTLLSPFPALLFMGEEYGEPAPFQFFSDHIDPDIAQATRDGRRAEFAAFAEFAGQQIPDPQDVATFERSKLSRERDEQLAGLYRELIAARGELPMGDVDTISFDESDRWLRVTRGRFQLVCNFAAATLRMPCDAQGIRIATSDETRLAGGVLELAPLSGALLRDT